MWRGAREEPASVWGCALVPGCRLIDLGLALRSSGHGAISAVLGSEYTEGAVECKTVNTGVGGEP